MPSGCCRSLEQSCVDRCRTSAIVVHCSRPWEQRPQQSSTGVRGTSCYDVRDVVTREVAPMDDITRAAGARPLFIAYCRAI
jgi:hypothetical protein